MEDKLLEKLDEKIQHIIDEDINTNNIDNLVKLSKVKHYTKEDKQMNYGNYGNYSGRGPGHGSYGNYGNYGESYGRRGVDSRYRGGEYLDRMAGEYGRYQEGRSYGAGEEVDKSFHYMVKALEDFIRVLYEEANTEPQRQQLREALQRSMM